MSKFKYSVGPWNVHTGSDPYGPAVRSEIPFEEKVRRFKEIFPGFYFGVHNIIDCGRHLACQKSGVYQLV